MAIRMSAGLVPFLDVVDRFLPGGYRDGLPSDEQLGRASEIEGLDGIGFNYPGERRDVRQA